MFSSADAAQYDLLPYEPPRSYRPPAPGGDDQPGGPEFLEREGNGPTARGPWDGGDLLGAIGLAIAVIVFVLFIGVFVDLVAEDAETGLIFRAGVTAAVSIALGLTIAGTTGLPRAVTVNFFGLAATANVLVHIVSDFGEARILGLTPVFVESAILSGLPLGAAWLYVVRKRGRSLRDLGLVQPPTSTAYLTAIGAWILAYVGVVMWSLVIADIESLAPPDNTTSALEIAGGSVAVAWLLVGLWGPAAEEIFFRGFLIGGLRSSLGAWPAILISSAVFALFHIDPGLYVPTFILGVAFGWVYLKTRSIWPSILAHTLHNTLALVVVAQDLG